jgi:hypothetical protein
MSLWIAENFSKLFSKNLLKYHAGYAIIDTPKGESQTTGERKMTKITGIKKAVGEYQRANAGGYYSARYGVMMLDRSTGEVWCDEFFSLGHNSWKVYHDAAIINLGREIVENGEPVNMKTVKEYADRMCGEYIPQD